MNWYLFAIWFGCGFACREVIWRTQLRIAKKHFNQHMEEMRPKLDQLRLDIERFQQLNEEKQNGDNQ